MDNELFLSLKDRNWISFFFSVLILSAIFSFMGDIVHDVMLTTTSVEGTVTEYTLDSMTVDINWLVEYKHSIQFTETDLLEMRFFINDIMKEDIKKLINETTYQDYLILSESRKVMSGKRTTIILFNN